MGRRALALIRVGALATLLRMIPYGKLSGEWGMEPRFPAEGDRP